MKCVGENSVRTFNSNYQEANTNVTAAQMGANTTPHKTVVSRHNAQKAISGRTK